MSETTVSASDYVTNLLDEIAKEMADKRTLPGERSGLRIADVIVRRTAESMGIEYE